MHQFSWHCLGWQKNILYTQMFCINLSVYVFSLSYHFSFWDLTFTISIFCPPKPYHKFLYLLKGETVTLFLTEPLLVMIIFDSQGAEESDHEEKEKDEPVDAAADPHRLLNVDLSK